MTSAGALSACVRAHVETWRPYTLWYVGLVGLGGAALVDASHHPWRLVAAWAAPTAGWIGGHYLGDYLDRDLDAGSKPYRPIPSGRLSPWAALRSGLACFAVLAALAAAGGWATGAAAALGTCGIIAYSRWFKARGVAGNLVRGALGALALAYGAAAAGATPTGAAWTALSLLALAFWLHDTASNLVGTLRDIDGDRAGGYETLPVRRGAGFTVRVVFVLYIAALCAALAGGMADTAGHRAAFLATLPVAAALGALALAPLPAHRAAMPVTVALRAHSVLVLERVVLASAVVGLGLGPARQLALAVPMTALTWRTQTAMRARHELGPGTPPAPKRRRIPMEDPS